MHSFRGKKNNKEIDISQLSAAPQWTYRRPDARVFQCLWDGDVEHSLVGVFSQLPQTKKVSHIHHQPYYLHVAVELKYLELALPAQTDTRTSRIIHAHILQ